MTEQEVDDLYQRTLEAIENLELKNMLRREEDQMDAVLKINAGAGGTEAQDWAQMLMRMYMRWAESNGYKCTVSNVLDGDDAGIKTCTLEIMGEFAYGYLKSVQQPQLVAFVDTPFDGEAAQGVTNRLVAVNDRLYPVKGTVKAVDAETGAVVYEGAVEIPANGTKLLAENLKLAAQGMLRVDYAFEGVPRVNRCLYGRPPFAYDAYVRWRSR